MMVSQAAPASHTGTVPGWQAAALWYYAALAFSGTFKLPPDFRVDIDSEVIMDFAIRVEAWNSNVTCGTVLVCRSIVSESLYHESS
jgi:hypothetical protein